MMGQSQGRGGNKKPPSTFDFPKAWSLLPLELKAAILSKLPTRTRARSRRVCLEWDTLLKNREVWADYRRLTLRNRGIWTPDEARARKTVNLQGGKESTPNTRLRFVNALEFLQPRCEIAALELLCLSGLKPTSLEGILSAVTESSLKLRSLTACQWLFRPSEEAGLRDTLEELIVSQTNLESLILGPFMTKTTDVNYISLSPLEALEQVPNLLSLVLHLPDYTEVLEMPASVLARLNTLVVYFWNADSWHWPDTDEEYDDAMTVNEEKAEWLCDYVKESAPSLQPCVQEMRSGVCRLAWAKEGCEMLRESRDYWTLDSYSYLNYRARRIVSARIGPTRW